jgi:hypothetical protein
MAAKSHGTRRRYNEGCRCDECRHAQALYQRRYRERKANGLTRPHAPPVVVAELPQAEAYRIDTPGPVEAAVQQEIGGLAQAELRPGLVAIAAAMARVLDSTPPTPKPAAAKVLVNVLDTLHKGSAQGRRGNLAVVKSMTRKGGGLNG